MLITCHNLNKNVPIRIAFIQGRARAETMWAEDVLHDRGAISMIRLRQSGRGRSVPKRPSGSFQLAAVEQGDALDRCRKTRR